MCRSVTSGNDLNNLINRQTNLYKTMKKKPLIDNCFKKLAAFMVMFFLLFSGTILGEDIKSESSENLVTLNIKEEVLTNVIQSIIKQSGLEIVFFTEQTSAVKCRNISFTSQTVDKALEIVLKGTGLMFQKQKEKYVILKAPAESQQHKAVKQFTLYGKVTDSSGEPLPGVNIVVKSTKKGTSSDIDGKYKIVLPSGEIILEFSFIGMETKELKVNLLKDATINVSLKDRENSLKELTFVSTGYQKMNKRDMVGALSTVKLDDVMMPNYATIDQMLQGVVPGMVVTSASSRVGTSPSIQIRGTSTLLGDSSPLWVVDGIIQEDPIKINASTYMSDDIKNIIGNQVSWLNPQDIETITVLKDASSTAIYGSKASNGVIVITTKQAKGSGDRLTVNYTGNVSVNIRPNYGQFNLMNSQERVQFSDEIFASGVPYSSVPFYDYYSYEGTKRLFIEGYISEKQFAEKRKFFETANTDWFKLLTRNAISQNHNVSLAGGSNKINFTSSVGYFKQQGQEIGNDSDRYSGRIAVGIQLSDKVRLNVSMTGSYNFNAGFGYGVNPLSYATQTSRAIPAYDENGKPAFYQKIRTYQYNAIQQSLDYNFINERNNSNSNTESMRFAANADLNWNILPWLTYNFTGGYNFASNAMSSYMSEQTYHIANTYRGYNYGTVQPASEFFKAAVLPFGGEYFTNDARQKSYNLQNKFSLFWNLKNNSRLNVLFGQELRSVTSESTANTVWGYSKERGEVIIKPTLPQDLVPTAGTYSTYTGYGILDILYNDRWKRLNQTNNFLSFFATAAYTFDEKYVLNASVRNDFSNRFGQDVNQRIDPTYSFGMSWRLAEEKFMRKYLPQVTQFNIRATYGIQGNAITTESPDLILYRQSKMNIFNQYYSTISKIPNPNLTWERTSNWNIGADLMLFKKVSFVFDYYTRKSNAIISQDIPYEFGIYATTMNGGLIYNKGLEATVTFSPINKPDKGLSISLNTSKNWNSTGPTLSAITQANYLYGKTGAIIKEGYPLNSFWSYSFAGLDPANGNPLFNLLDTDSELAKADPSSFLVYSGESTPSFSGGLSMNFRYKSFSVGTGFSLLLGGKTRLPNPYSSFSSGRKLPSSEFNVNRQLLNRWKQPGDELYTNIPSINPLNTVALNLPNGTSGQPVDLWAMSDAMIVDASFLRCKNIDITWRLSKKALNDLNLKSMSVTASMNNIFVIASNKFNGMDPELKNSVMPKTFTLGLAIGL